MIPPLATNLSDARRFSVAPMMDWTDRHCRYFHRVLSRRALLFTEMVTSAAIVHGPFERLLRFDPVEQPVALQLGGSDPVELAKATQVGSDFGYAEVNLNVGCPSDRVQSGKFGACLMAEPELVAACVMAMKAATDRPVTVKCRLGIDDQDTGAPLDRFADLMIAAGADALYVHARKAWLKGLSPKENRSIPPLDHQRVYRLAERLAPYPVLLNGGVETLAEVQTHLAYVAGVMLGRAAYHSPMMLTEMDALAFGDRTAPIALPQIMARMADYAERELSEGTRLNAITRHMLGLANGLPGARMFRQLLSVDAVKAGAGPELLFRALAAIDISVLQAAG
ncbi:MAG: tRNA dihydrouridine synthase [Devosia sp.]|nr:tRNA dihydrouridine synthase [Devosia sp.]